MTTNPTINPLASIIDFTHPEPNIKGVPFALLTTTVESETLSTLAMLHKRGRASTHLAEYAAYTLDVIPAAHHRVICEAIDALLRDEFDELIINTPPGAAKSTYTSHALAAYYMGVYPEHSIILATHTADLSEK